MTMISALFLLSGQQINMNKKMNVWLCIMR